MEQAEKYKKIMHYLDEWMNAKEENRSIGSCLKKRNVNSVGIYGYGILGRHLLRELITADINVKWVMDNRDVSDRISCLYLHPDSAQVPLDIDLVIITAITDVEEIEKKLINMSFERVIFIGELFEEIRYQHLL